jgi:hypothetical protein
MKTKTGLLFFVLLFCISDISAAANIGGIINQDMTLKTSESPYDLTSNMEIGEGVTVTVEPGVLLNAAGGNIGLFGGSLIIAGTADNKVQIEGGVSFSSAIYKQSTLNVDHCRINGLKYANFMGINLSIKNSEIIRSKGFSGQISIGYPLSDPLIEKNILIGIFGCIGDANNKYLRFTDNIFYGQSGACGTLNMVFLNNSFLSPSLPFAVCNYVFDLKNNYWGTTDIALIEDRIKDRSDTLDCSNRADYQPILLAPHPDTPAFDPEKYTDFPVAQYMTSPNAMADIIRRLQVLSGLR